MTQFFYTAIDASGRRIRGRIDAINPADLEMRLRRMELDLIRGEALGSGALLGPPAIPRREIIHFCFHLELLIRAGVPLLEGLGELRDSIAHPRFRGVVASLIADVEGGLALSQAMAAQGNIFSGVFVSLIRCGEASGRLSEVLRRLTETLKWEDEFAAYTQRLVLYPAFVATVVCGAAGFLMLTVAPQLKVFVRNMEQTLPPHTQALFFVSDLLAAYWYVILILPGILFVGTRCLLNANPLARTRFDGMKLSLPLFGGILHKIVLSRFASTLALLYASGIPVVDAIRATQDVVDNEYVRRELAAVEQRIDEGKNIAAAFDDARVFPPLVVRMLRVGESTGTLDVALDNISYFYTRDVRESIEKLQQLVEPTLTVVLGSLLGWIMLSVLGPVYDVVSQIKG